MNTEQIVYLVTTFTDVHTKTLGYCTGNPDDILEFYRNQTIYGLNLEPINIKHITQADVANKQVLLNKKKALQEELERVNRYLD